MKRLIALGAVALVLAAPAGAATPQQRIAKLEAQVKTLSVQVKKLQTAERVDRNETAANYTGDACLAATMADFFQSTWAMIDLGATTPKFTTEPLVSDSNACQAIGVTRLGIKQPPTVSTVIGAFVKWAIG